MQAKTYQACILEEAALLLNARNHLFAKQFHQHLQALESLYTRKENAAYRVLSYLASYQMALQKAGHMTAGTPVPEKRVPRKTTFEREVSLHHTVNRTLSTYIWGITALHRMPFTRPLSHGYLSQIHACCCIRIKQPVCTCHLCAGGSGGDVWAAAVSLWWLPPCKPVQRSGGSAPAHFGPNQYGARIEGVTLYAVVVHNTINTIDILHAKCSNVKKRSRPVS